MKKLDSNILKILDKYSYEMFVVQQGFKIDCSCVDFTTKQASNLCPKCLGTGKKIKIRKITAMSQNNKVAFYSKDVRETATARIYYVKGNMPIYQDNIFVNGIYVDVIQHVEPMCSNNHSPVFYRCGATPKKSNIQIFLQNFRKIVRR
jgi:hypothetical protein